MLNDYNALFIGLYYSNDIANALHELLINSRLPSNHPTILKYIQRHKARRVSPQKKRKTFTECFLCEKDKTLRVDSGISGYDRLLLKKGKIIPQIDITFDQHGYCSPFLLSLISTYSRFQFPGRRDG